MAWEQTKQVLFNFISFVNFKCYIIYVDYIVLKIKFTEAKNSS